MCWEQYHYRLMPAGGRERSAARRSGTEARRERRPGGEGQPPGVDASKLAALLPLRPPARDGPGASLRSERTWRAGASAPSPERGARPTARREGARGWAPGWGMAVAKLNRSMFYININ